MIATQAARLSHITEEILLTSGSTGASCGWDVSCARRRRRAAPVETMRAQLPKSTTIDVEIPAEVGEASGDVDRLSRCRNLLDNAVKYGGDHVEVRATDDGKHPHFVADTGPGISLADRELVFEKFYRADPQLSKAPGGTGLGRHLRELTERMGGRLDLSSGKGGGAIVRRRAAESLTAPACSASGRARTFRMRLFRVPEQHREEQPGKQPVDESSTRAEARELLLDVRRDHVRGDEPADAHAGGFAIAHQNAPETRRRASSSVCSALTGPVTAPMTTTSPRLIP